MRHGQEILRLALPAIVSNITTPVLALVDVAITGHIGGAVFIGAIAVGGSMFNMLYWLFNFLRMGSSGLTAQAYGAGNSRGTSLVLQRGLAVGLGVALILLALHRPLGDLVINFMDADDACAALARRYFNICIWGCPAVMCAYALSGWFVGVQDSKATMWMALVTNVVNIAASATLVFGMGLRIEGVALGTAIAQWVGAATGLVLAHRRFAPKRMPLREILAWDDMVKFFRINSDIFFRTACLVAVTLWFTHAGALEGTSILAANALLLQLFMLFSFFMDGFAFAGEALAGKYEGAANRNSLRSLVRELLLWGLGCAAVFSVAYTIGGEWFMGFIAEDKSVVSTAARYLPWAVAIPLCGFMAFVFDGVLVGLTRTRAMLASMAISAATFFAVWFAARTSMGNDGLWLSFIIYLGMRGVIEWLIWRIRIS